MKSGSFPIKEITEYLGYTKYKFGYTYTNISISLATYQSIWVYLDEYIYLSSYLPINVPIIYQCSERKREVKIYRRGEDGRERMNRRESKGEREKRIERGEGRDESGERENI